MCSERLYAILKHIQSNNTPNSLKILCMNWSVICLYGYWVRSLEQRLWLVHMIPIFSRHAMMLLCGSYHYYRLRGDQSRFKQRHGGIFTSQSSSTASAITSRPGCHSKPYVNTILVLTLKRPPPFLCLKLKSDRCQDRNVISTLSLRSKKPTCSDVQHNWPTHRVTFPSCHTLSLLLE